MDRGLGIRVLGLVLSKEGGIKWRMTWKLDSYRYICSEVYLVSPIWMFRCSQS